MVGIRANFRMHCRRRRQDSALVRWDSPSRVRGVVPGDALLLCLDHSEMHVRHPIRAVRVVVEEECQMPMLSRVSFVSLEEGAR